jgi:hypothetical protein
MSQATLSQFLNQFFALPPEDREKVREILTAPAEEQQRIEAARALAVAVSLRDFSADRQWLLEHRHEYAWQWVALKDGQLISHSKNAKEVFAAAKAAGHPDALVVLVEPEPEPGHKIINLG